MKGKKLVALLLASAMCLSLLASCGKKDPDPTPTPPAVENTQPVEPQGPTYTVTEFSNDKYTYKTYTIALAPNWNPHDYESANSADVLDYLVDGLYQFAFNDELHPHADPSHDPYDAYVIIPAMAAGDPVDVTMEVKAAHPDWIPADATSGFAWAIPLRQDLYFDTGYHITAESFVEGAKRLLDPKLQNYRSTDVYSGANGIVGAEAYFKPGEISTGEANGYTFADLTANAEGQYETPDGYPVYIAVEYGIEYFDGDALADYIGAYGDAYFSLTNWEDLTGAMDENGLVPLTDETYPWIQDVITGNPEWNESDADLPNYWVYVTGVNPTDPVFEETVGIYAKDEYTLVQVYKSSLAGFSLYYGGIQDSLLLVEPNVYDSCLYQDEQGVWQSSYMTSAETSPSYGPYSMTEYQTDKMVHYSRNDKWYGYHDDENSVYMDPTDGKVYRTYQSTDVDVQVVPEAPTAKQMFLAGELMTYSMQSTDYDEYGFSDYLYATPSASVFFFLMTRDMSGLQTREASADFDQSKYDLETITLTSFRKAIAVSIDKQAACDDIYTSNTPAYGIYGPTQIYDPETCGFYRDTPQAKQALCDFYSIDVSKFNGDLDAAAASITGYDPDTAKALYTEAFNEALEAGYITSADGKTSDQTIRMYYAATTHSDTMMKRIDYLSNAVKKAAEGTPFEGKLVIEADPKLYDSGSAWADAIKTGESDMQIAGWTGSAMNPFSLLQAYTWPSYAYAANWYDTTTDMMTLKLNGEEITMSVYDWAEAVNGSMMTDTNGKSRIFGENDADIETRLTILAAIEGKILQTYTYIPLINNGSKFLLTQQAYFVVEEYNPVLSRGGIKYMKYNYNDTDWAAYCADQIAAHGQLQY